MGPWWNIGVFTFISFLKKYLLIYVSCSTCSEIVYMLLEASGWKINRSGSCPFLAQPCSCLSARAGVTKIPQAPANPAHVSAWNLQLRILESGNLGRAGGWGGAGRRLKAAAFGWILCWVLQFLPLAFLDYEPKGSILTIGFGWKKKSV